MEEDVVDNADKSVGQQANCRYQRPLLKGGQKTMEVHVGTGTVAYRGQEFIRRGRGHTKMDEMNLGSSFLLYHLQDCHIPTVNCHIALIRVRGHKSLISNAPAAIGSATHALLLQTPFQPPSLLNVSLNVD
jgi:hypothetical protein